MRSQRLRSLLILIIGGVVGCGSNPEPVAPHDAGADAAFDAGDAGERGDGGDAGERDAGVMLAPDGEPWPRLSQWGLFADIAAQEPSARVVPYAVNAQLYADEADKHRFVFIPQGATIEYHASRAWRFPVGTVLVKTFSYARAVSERDGGAAEEQPRLLETRLLVREQRGWAAHTYIYGDDPRDAERKVAGKRIALRFRDADGALRDNDYSVPNTNQCGDCHGRDAALDTLGGTTRQLNRDAPDVAQNQIARFIELGWLTGAEPDAARARLVDPFGDAPLVDRMRAYADANCGHCHNEEPESGDDGSGLWLRFDETDPASAEAATLGVCKMPQSAGGATCGLTVDVLPGDPDGSILVCRMESEDPQVQMPPLGRNLQDARGTALLREWIESLEGACD
jgi:uncharacterized repeat protein (TIGR03806 family)